MRFTYSPAYVMLSPKKRTLPDNGGAEQLPIDCQAEINVTSAAAKINLMLDVVLEHIVATTNR